MEVASKRDRSERETVQAEFAYSELEDMGRLVRIVLDADGRRLSFRLSRYEAQKLFDKMWWAYYFRPTENP